MITAFSSCCATKKPTLTATIPIGPTSSPTKSCGMNAIVGPMFGMNSKMNEIVASRSAKSRKIGSTTTPRIWNSMKAKIPATMLAFN